MTTLALGARKAVRPANVAKIRPSEVIDFVRRILRESPELAQVCERVDFEEGRPRRLRVDVLIAAAVAHAVTEESNIHVRGVAALLRALPVPEQRVLGVRWTDPNGGERIITERQVEYLFGRIAHAFSTDQHRHDHMFALDDDVWSPDGEWVAPCDALTDEERATLECGLSCPRGVSMETIGNLLLARLWQQTGMPDTDRWAVDSAVVETHFATKSWGAVANMDPANVPDDAQDRVELTPYPEHAQRTARKPPGGRTPNERTRNHTRTLIASANEESGTVRDPRSRRPEPVGPVAPGSFTRYSTAFPQIAPDGRLAHTKDAGARNAYRGAGNNRPSAIVNGRDKHALVASGALPDGTAFPPLTRAYRAVPGGDDKTQAFLTLLDYARTTGVEPAIVTADRIYSAAKPEKLQHLIDSAGWTLVRDLKDDQRRHRQWTNGVHYLDGWWFTSGMPQGLVALERAPRNVSSAQRLEYQEKFNARAAYAFRRNGNLTEGGFRLRGPAVPDSKTLDPITGRPTSMRGVRVRCANSALFHYLPRTLPKTTCIKGQPCGCSLTIAIRAAEVPNSCEPLLWGTTRWAKQYYRRNLSESSFSLDQYHYGLDRHSIRVRAGKWDLAFAIVNLAAFVRLFHSFVMRLGAWALDPGYHSAYDEPVYRQAISRVLEPMPTERSAAPPG